MMYLRKKSENEKIGLKHCLKFKRRRRCNYSQIFLEKIIFARHDAGLWAIMAKNWKMLTFFRIFFQKRSVKYVMFIRIIEKILSTQQNCTLKVGNITNLFSTFVKVPPKKHNDPIFVTLLVPQILPTHNFKENPAGASCSSVKYLLLY